MARVHGMEATRLQVEAELLSVHAVAADDGAVGFDEAIDVNLHSFKLSESRALNLRPRLAHCVCPVAKCVAGGDGDEGFHLVPDFVKKRG